MNQSFGGDRLAFFDRTVRHHWDCMPSQEGYFTGGIRHAGIGCHYRNLASPEYAARTVGEDPAGGRPVSSAGGPSLPGKRQSFSTFVKDRLELSKDNLEYQKTIWSIKGRPGVVK